MELLKEAMSLVWTVTCSRCKTEEIAETPDDMDRGAEILSDYGWIATKEKNVNKEALAQYMDTSKWPDEVTYVLCPDCRGVKRV